MLSRPKTIFHITHWKAGSQWVAEILKQSAPRRFVPWQVHNPHTISGRGRPSFYMKPLRRGKIYGTVYLSREIFQRVIAGHFWKSKERTFFSPLMLFGNWWNFEIRKSPYRSFVVIRDLRDTLISFYFSLRKSHVLITDYMARVRQELESSSEEDGMVYMISEVLPTSARIQATWINVPDVLLLRYEDILGNEYSFFEQLVDYCQIKVSREKLHALVESSIFETSTGRKRGEEDINAHLRKGISGDWRNYFTENIKTEFKKHYGKLLIDTGYEKDLNW
jgi:lipopolysaccharide transport system ATP-binding protein